jgi:superfamily I DNA/RNA helicase
MPVEYVLEKPVTRRLTPPELDVDQRAVVDHPGGPLLVLAGPGTGKTTTLVELVVDRVERGDRGELGGLDAGEVLVLTFSRKAAGEVRARIARRLDRTTSTTPAMTFHAFCYAMLRAEQHPDDYASPIRLLSAPEHDAVISEVLSGVDPEAWPTELRQALQTRGMAAELQRLMSTARARGMDAADLQRLGASAGRADWEAAGRFFDEYTAVAALQNTIDHTDLVLQAVRLLDDPECRARWRRRFSLVVVDEYQDTDPLQVELLEALAGDGRDLVVVGDPYQSIYGFRGADVRGILGFADRFATARTTVPVITLGHTNRYGPTIGAAVRSIVDNRGVLGAVDGEAYARLRSPVSRSRDEGEVAVHTFSSPTAEAEHIALLLREAHLHHELPWEQMAVLVRSGAHVGRLQRALVAAGVPVEVAGDEIPLALEPAVRTLLGAVHAADTLHQGQQLDPQTAAALLTGPLGGLDAPSLRRLGRALRRAEASGGEAPRPSRVLVAEALSDPVHLQTLAPPGGPEGDAVRAAASLARLLTTVAEQIRDRQPVEQVLWTVWQASGWARRLEAEATGDGDGAPRANHDLDALCALFAEAARAEEQQSRLGIAEVVTRLEAQQIPADNLAQQGGGGRAVQLMTAHRSKGLEWQLVVVAGVQDGEWPDTRLRSTLLQVDRVGAGAVQPPPSPREALAEERRLFYVACSRARSRLVVTAVASGDDAGDQPSRFVAELHAHTIGRGGRVLPEPQHRPRRALNIRGAVAELRRIGEQTDDHAVRARVAAMLAGLSAHPLGQAASPDRWWGLREPTAADTPVRDPAEPLRLSGSSVSTMVDCPLHWFLGHEARGERGTTSAQGFGSIVHAIAAEVVASGLEPDPQQLADHLDTVWAQLDYPAWVGARERAAAVESITRFCRWHREHGREVLAVEHRFEVETQVDGRPVLLNGSMDRVELDDDGVHVVDLKTSRGMPSGPDIREHPQLGFYQLAVALGAAVGLPGAEHAAPAGAELVQLRNGETKTPDYPKVQPQDAPRPDEPFFALEQLRRSVHAIDGEQFPATASVKACQYCEFGRVCPAKDEGASILVERS